MDGPGDAAAAPGQFHDGVRYDFGKLPSVGYIFVLTSSFTYVHLKSMQFLMLTLEMESLCESYPIIDQVCLFFLMLLSATGSRVTQLVL